MVFIIIWCLSQLSVVGTTEFILPTIGLGNITELNANIIVSNSGQHPVDVTVNVNFNNSVVQTFSTNVASDDVSNLPLNNILAKHVLNGSEIANKSIVIESSSNDVGVHVILGESFHNEGFAAISTDHLGTKYYVSTFCALGGYCQIAIATVENGTTNLYVELPNEADEVAICVGKRTWTSSDLSFYLTYPESVQIESTHDLTGTFIYSDRPLSVVTGTRSMPVQNLGSTYTHFYEQLAPVSHWGTEFALRGFGIEYGSIVHITAYDQFTYVDMTGYRRTEISSGYTIRRRLETDTVAYIQTSKAVQVVVYTGITYQSNEVMHSVAMTTLPALEHFSTSYVASCGSGMTTTYQYVTTLDNSISAHTYADIIMVHLSNLKVVDVALDSPDPLISSYSSFGGIMTCDTSVFPIAPPVKPTLVTPCTPSLSRVNSGDGIDNNCEGSVDENLCYENVKVTIKFVSNNTGVIPTHTVNVHGFYEILVRVQSCDISQIELLYNNHSEQVVIHISRSRIDMYSCTPDCVYVGGLDKRFMTINTNCSKIVRSYWIIQYQNKLCVNTGRNSMDGHCDDEHLMVTLDKEIDDMRLSGLTSDAIFWYDVYKPDCGQFKSDWRCEDELTNCYQYGTDVCTNPDYVHWVDVYCRKYCGFCSPDHYGRMFVYVPAPIHLHNVSHSLVIVGSDGDTSKIGLETSTMLIDTESMKINAYNSTQIDAALAWIGGHSEVIHIFTEKVVLVSYVYKNTSFRFVQPTDVLGTEYMTVSFTNSSVTPDGALTCLFKPLAPDTVLCVYTKFSSNCSTSFTTDLYAGDQTGTVVKANQPFTAWCGTSDLSEYGFSWYQLPPTNTWGTLYMTPSIGNNISRSIRAKIRIVTNSNSTAFEIHGDFDGIYELLARGDFKEFEIDPSVVYKIESNFAITVVVIYYLDVNKTDSSLHILPPVTSFADNPLVLFGYDPIDMRVSITQTTNISDDSGIQTGDDTILSIHEQQPGLFTYQQNSTDASFLFSLKVSNSSISVVPSSSLFKDLSWERVCHVMPDSGDDGLDNDCDGLIDEETTCVTGYATMKTDLDIDGSFGEDCGSFEAGKPWTSPPLLPDCELVIHPLYSCSAYCQCKCSWSKALHDYNNMTDAEKKAYNDDAIAIYKEALKIDKSQLSSTVAERESADDERQSSKNIGFVGVLLIICVLLFIVSFDMITLVQKIKSKLNSTNIQTVS